MKTLNEIDSFTRHYLIAALWSTNDNSTPQGGNPLDDNYTLADLTPEAIEASANDCKAFQRDNAELLAKAGSAEQNGHDCWLTRNGHGAGFWDRGYPSEVGKPLSDAARIYGTVDLYVTDEGKVSL